jgi:copper resistance protein B
VIARQLGGSFAFGAACLGTAFAQTLPPTVPTLSTAAANDMQDMDRSAPPAHAHDSSSSQPQKEMTDMPGMAAVQPDATAGSSGMAISPMQGGSSPPGARSPDYSDGVGQGSMQGMDMADNAALGMLLLDKIEAVQGRNADSQVWELQGWYGNDLNKLWLRSEGERSSGQVEDGDVEALWNRAVSTYWNTQLGVRHDFGIGPNRTWAAFGVEGLAPYWFAIEATAYVGQSGRTAFRFRATYDLLLTQRLILQPEFELNAYGKGDPARHIGSGLSDTSLGLRLRYEIRREFAPYVGVNWIRRYDGTANALRQEGKAVFDPQIVVGVRVWF